MSEKGPYTRVYQTIVDDPMFARVYHNDHALATWLRMLLIADAMYPVTAPMPPRNPTVRLLIDCGLVLQRDGNRYSMRGLQAERERRSHAGRIAAAVRWQSERNANALPIRDEQSKEEKSKDAIASEKPVTFMGFKPPRRLAASLQDIEAQHNREFELCGQCGQRRATHRSDHPFKEGGA